MLESVVLSCQDFNRFKQKDRKNTNSFEVSAKISLMKILIVKLSSLGDVLHNLPIVWDLRAKYPNAQIDWVVEEGYVSLLEPLKSANGINKGPYFKGVDRIIPLAFRRWKKALKRGEFIKSIQEYIAFKADLQTTQYDLIIEPRAC
jgi:heptosyltransferase I